MNPKISIVIVTYNSIKYLPGFIDSIFDQSYYKKNNSIPDICVIDNASDDDTVNFIKDNFPTVKLLRNMRNIGLAKAWNHGIKMTSGQFILIMNPDLMLDPSCIENMLAQIQADRNIASISPKLYKLKVDTDSGQSYFEYTNIIDSCGLLGFKNRRFVDLGADKIDKGQFDSVVDIFGPSGALALYRRQALEDIKFEQEYFDENFFMYKEDVDIAWRLRLAGWNSIFCPQAVGYHHRRARSQSKKIKHISIIRHRLKKQNFVNFYSYRNHIMLLYKNSFSSNFVRYMPWILFYELKKFLYVLVLENSNLRRTISDLFKFYKNLKQKKILIRKNRRIKAIEIRLWFQ